MELFEPVGTLVGLAFLAFMVAGGLLLVRESVGLFRDVAAMVLTRTARIDSVRAGRVEVSGEVRPAERTLTDPVSGDEAVAYEYEASHERGLKRDPLDWTRWGYRTETDGGVAVPFDVEDESGRVRVEPGDPDDEHAARDGAINLYATRDADLHLDAGERDPARLRHLFAKTGISELNGDVDRLYETARIEPGDEVYVLGTATFRDGDRVIEGGDDRFVVAGGSQLRTLVYNAGWGVSKLVAGLGLATGCGLLLVLWVSDLAGVSLGTL